MENPISMPSGAPEVKKEKYIISIIIFILVILVAYLAWYVNGRPQTLPPPPLVPESAPAAKEAAPPPSPEAQVSLGGDIYQQAQNPVKDKLPEGASPVTNPIGGAYKNPFE